MQVTTSSYPNRTPVIDEFAILTKFLYTIITTVNYPYMTNYMICKYISWKIELAITFTKRPQDLMNLPSGVNLSIWLFQVSYVYVAKSINVNPASINKLPFSCAEGAKRHNEFAILGKLANTVISSI